MSRELLIVFCNKDVPADLRPVAPFIGEAQRYIDRFILNLSTSDDVRLRGERIVLLSLDQTVKLFNLLDSEINIVSEDFMRECVLVREMICLGLGRETSTLTPLLRNSLERYEGNMLLAEASELLDLATAQFQEGMRRDAYKTFHTGNN